jgi:signal transduction histidine kinase
MESVAKQPFRILVVEDSPTQAENLRYRLEQQGYRVFVARNGEEALKMTEQVRPTVVISDILMPKMDGFLLCKKIKANNKLKNIPFILLTALSDPQDVLRGLECGADDFITKPFDEEYLLAKIQQTLINVGIPRESPAQTGVEVIFSGKKYRITAERQQILNLLLSTYETAVIKNHELIKAQEELRSSRDELEVRIRERTTELFLANEGLRQEIVERQKMEEALLESKEQLRILASKILTAQEDERKRVALEVHDILGSSLSAIKFKVEEALINVPKDLSYPLEVLIPLIKETIEEARRIQADLRPPLLDDLGLLATISWFCRRFETIYSAIRVEQMITIREEEVPDHLKTALFRIIQEAMTNIGKHAGADYVGLGLRKVDATIELSIRDNGEGFDQEALSSKESLKKGLGLSSMRERTEFSEGTFSIESGKGYGTVVKAVWQI